MAKPSTAYTTMRIPKLDQLHQARVYAEALGKHFSKSDTIPVNGEPHKVSDLVAMFEAHEALVTKSVVTRAEWLVATGQADASHAALQPLVDGIGAHVRANFGVGSSAYIDFGLKEHKVGKKTADVKARAVTKAAETRKARHPKGASAQSGPAPEPVTPPSPPPKPT
jgi:hypothetical protein